MEKFLPNKSGGTDHCGLGLFDKGIFEKQMNSWVLWCSLHSNRIWSLNLDCADGSLFWQELVPFRSLFSKTVVPFWFLFLQGPEIATLYMIFSGWNFIKVMNVPVEQILFCIVYFTLLLVFRKARVWGSALRSDFTKNQDIRYKKMKYEIKIRPTDPLQNLLCNPNHTYFLSWPNWSILPLSIHKPCIRRCILNNFLGFETLYETAGYVIPRQF